MKNSGSIVQDARGVTLVELMVMSVIASLVALTVIQGFSGISRGVIATRFKSLATQAANQEMQSLKSTSYYRLRVSSQTVVPPEFNAFTPAVRSDVINYPPTDTVINGIHFTHYTVVERVEKNDGTENLEVKTWNSADTGLKQITMNVAWQERGTWKRVQLTNLLENPNRLAATGDFVGVVSHNTSSLPISDVLLSVAENSSMSALTGAAGSYRLGVPAGTYTLRASKRGWFSKTAANKVITSTTPQVTVDFLLTMMTSGTITGSVWQNDHLVISRVCGAKMDGVNSQEYVEIFNPTTWTWIADGQVGLTFQRQFAQDNAPIPIAMNYAVGGSNILPDGFYLFASTPTLNINGTLVNADAVWESSSGGANDTNFPYFDAAAGKFDILPVNGGPPNGNGGWEGAGVLTLTGSSTDRVGWQGAGLANPASYETAPIPDLNGMEIDEIYYRKSDVGGTFSLAVGPAYDSGNNAVDWGVDQTGGNTPPRSTASAPLPVISGTPSDGALIFADDGLSQMAQAVRVGSPPEARFTLPAIATGTWTVRASSGAYSRSYSTSIAAGVTLSTSIVINASTDYGFVSGKVINAATGVGISGIPLSHAGTEVTDAEGHFTVPLLPGPAVLTANPAGVNPMYTEGSQSVSVTLGQVTSNITIALNSAAKIRGVVTIDGITPLPDIPISVTNNMSGYVADNVVSGADGSFVVTAPVGIYTVAPITAFGEYVSPLTANVMAAAAGVTVFAGTYTVTSAFGTLSGRVSSQGTPINTGVLIIASTSAIPAALLEIDSNFRASGSLFYAGPSRSDGSYSFTIKSGTYTVSGWYTTFSGNTPTVTRTDHAGIVVLPRQTTTLDLAW
jgi:type II secretory pathway pseudopilin PulG